jgi:hypothetical protein
MFATPILIVFIGLAVAFGAQLIWMAVVYSRFQAKLSKRRAEIRSSIAASLVPRRIKLRRSPLRKLHPKVLEATR